MRRLLIDHARGKRRTKRGGDRRRITFIEPLTPAADGGLGAEELLALHDAIERLARLDERQARIVELRFFGGLKVEETAHVLGVSRRTVMGDWAHARAWLKRELARGGAR